MDTSQQTPIDLAEDLQSLVRTAIANEMPQLRLKVRQLVTEELTARKAEIARAVLTEIEQQMRRSVVTRPVTS